MRHCAVATPGGIVDYADVIDRSGSGRFSLRNRHSKARRSSRDALINPPPRLPADEAAGENSDSYGETEFVGASELLALGVQSKKRKTRRDRFLFEIEAVVPWTTLTAAIEPFYPKGEGRGRGPFGLERMLRMYIAQQCFGLSDEGVEDAVYDSQATRSGDASDEEGQPVALRDAQGRTS